MRTQSGEVVKNTRFDEAIKNSVVQVWNGLRNKADGEFKNYEDFLYLPLSNYVPVLHLPPGLKHVVLAGIGGSSLGAKAVYDALFGFYDSVEPRRFPKLHILENVDKAYVETLMSMLSADPDPNGSAFVIVSKSGKTFETGKNLETMMSDKFRGMVNGVNTYVISIEGSQTWEWGKKIGAKLYPIPPIVSGRFQVFGAVSLVPLTLSGVNTLKFLDGAKQGVKNSEELQKNVEVRYQYYKEGWDGDVYFCFDDRLKSLADWMCSITAESLGKSGAGITPMTSVGSRDLHSSGQLYLQGKRNKFTTFISLSDTDKDNLFILDAVKKAYDDAQLPYSHTILDSVDSGTLTQDLGEYMQSKIIETVLLGGLMGVNPYDQPGVELYKKYLQ